jgi:uncharacterized repeat protein (TIGR01451 family)
MDFDNAGTVEVQSGVLHLPNDYEQTDGLTLLNGGDLLSSDMVDIQGGVLGGTGTVTGMVQSNGVISPGLSAGQLNIAGDYTQISGGEIGIEIGGVTSGTTYDIFNVNGNAQFTGSLSVSLIDGFVPAINDSFTVVTYHSTSGALSSYNLPELSRLTWEVVESDSAITLNVKAVDLVLSKTAVPNPVLAGDTLTYTLIVTNTGNLTGTNVVLTDNLPSFVTFVSGTTNTGGNCTEAALTVSCDLSDMAPEGPNHHRCRS